MSTVLSVLIVCGTFFTSVLVFVVGQLLLRIYIEPAHELKKSIAAVQYNFDFFAREILTPSFRTAEKSVAAGDALRKTSADLSDRCHSVLWYPMMARIFHLPEKPKVLTAVTLLRGLSTYMCESGYEALAQIDEVNERIERIERALSLRSLFGGETDCEND